MKLLFVRSKHHARFTSVPSWYQIMV